MEIVIIGTGNTAAVLGRKFKAAGHTIVQIFGRDATAASALAYELDTESTAYWSVVSRSADVYVLAVSDIAIADVVTELQLSSKTVVHTAASVSKAVLQGASAHFGVLYPLQTLKKELPYDPEVPIIIDASDSQTLTQLTQLAASISDTVVEAGDDARAKLHIAAVFCNNFGNHLFVLMEQYCAAEGLDFTLLQPLISETAARLVAMPPAQAQTGPALRNDTPTLQKHLHLLQAHPHLAQLYQIFTESIQRTAHI